MIRPWSRTGRVRLPTREPNAGVTIAAWFAANSSKPRSGRWTRSGLKRRYEISVTRRELRNPSCTGSSRTKAISTTWSAMNWTRRSPNSSSIRCSARWCLLPTGGSGIDEERKPSIPIDTFVDHVSLVVVGILQTSRLSKGIVADPDQPVRTAFAAVDSA